MQSHQAFAPHFDTHDVFALHCQGEKMWNIYDDWLCIGIICLDNVRVASVF